MWQNPGLVQGRTLVAAVFSGGEYLLQPGELLVLNSTAFENDDVWFLWARKVKRHSTFGSLHFRALERVMPSEVHADG